jgi:ligand-binding SRPBCC domain-containing protein
MPIIEINTEIHAPITRCFDLARSIDLHKLSTRGTEEEAVAGVTAGLIAYGETVTWRAKHFGMRQTLTSEITAFDYPFYFRDEMVKGPFAVLQHDHYFHSSGTKTIMFDKFYFESPGGIIGWLINKMFLEKYLNKLLTRRNQMIKSFAESDEWKAILKTK